MNTFKSDFSMIPLNKIGINGWMYKPATWPSHIDPLVHKLSEGLINEVKYDRKRWRDNINQTCTVYMENSQIYMNPGDGCIYKILKNTTHNKEPITPQSLKCLVCLDNNRTHSIQLCGHLVACSLCADILYKKKSDEKKCPLCNINFKSKLKKTII